MRIKGCTPDYIMLRAKKVGFRPFKGGEIWTMTYIEKFAAVHQEDLENAKKLLDALFIRLPHVSSSGSES